MGQAMLDSLRVRQWIKNGVIFAPLVFSGGLIHPASVSAAGWSFFLFCLASSGAYLFNDLLDRRVDRFHPVKKNRPIASGRLPFHLAAVSAGILLAGAAVGGILFHLQLGLLVSLYILLNILYSLTLKHQVIFDVMAISMGFVIRIWAGAVVLGIVPSHWLQLSMFFLGLFLGLAKRRQELITLHGKALRHRKVLSDYSPAFIDQLTSVLTAVTLLCYALYATSPEVVSRVGPFGFIYTVPVVVYAVFRYLYLIHIRNEALDPTETLLSDLPLALSVLLWSLLAGAILYW